MKPAGLTSRESASWVAPPPDDRKPVTENPDLCIYCHRYHGAVNELINCLKRGIVELRAQGIVLPGWTCHLCCAFNGAEKEQLPFCRGCGRPRP